MVNISLSFTSRRDFVDFLESLKPQAEAFGLKIHVKEVPLREDRKKNRR